MVLLTMSKFFLSLYVTFPLVFSVQKEIVKRRYELYNGSSLSDVTAIATEYTPLLKWLGFRSPGGLETREGNEKVKENFDAMSLDDQESLISDDEIEDW